MPMIVETPDYEPIFIDKVSFGSIDFAGQVFGDVLMTVKGRLVDDDKVLARSGGSLQNIERSAERGRDALHDRIRIAGLERIHGLLVPWHTHVFLDALDDLAGGDAGFLGSCL